jgi:hypothetical protein
LRSFLDFPRFIINKWFINNLLIVFGKWSQRLNSLIIFFIYLEPYKKEVKRLSLFFLGFSLIQFFKPVQNVENVNIKPENNTKAKLLQKTYKKTSLLFLRSLENKND